MTLEKLRQDIDEIDARLLSLLNERMEKAILTTSFKKTIEDGSREQAVLERIRRMSHGLVQPAFSEALFGKIMAESKELQSRKYRTIGFQGEHGAYSEVASKIFMREGASIPCREFSDVFEEVEAGAFDFGIVPVENTLGGLVGPVNSILIYTNLQIVAAVDMPVRHCLVCPPGTDHRELRHAWSHSQALSQCRSFLLRNHLDPVPTYDTAGAAREIAETRPKGVAAVASRYAAELYGLDIIKEDIQNSPHNRTRFFVLSRRSGETGGDRCSAVFTAGSKAGSLFRVLDVFARASINLTRIESVPDTPGRYAIFIDFEGSSEEPRVAEAISRVSSISEGFRLLGCYRETRVDA